jgi:hypothetical protein
LRLKKWKELRPVHVVLAVKLPWEEITVFYCGEDQVTEKTHVQYSGTQGFLVFV